jgi:hypothetical protein
MPEANGLVASPATEAIVGRQGKRPYKNNKPAAQGWHDETESARILGEDLQTRRRKRRAGEPPHDWIQTGRHVLYRDGAEEKFLAELLRKRAAAAEPRGRGRPRSNTAG